MISRLIFRFSGFRRICTALVLLLAVLPALAQSVPASRRFAVAHGRFELDGKPFQIIAGDMDYVRTPRAYWRDRLPHGPRHRDQHGDDLRLLELP